MLGESKIIGIHQPNFFPWLGYFNKIYRSDEFILLDDVQLQKTAGSWVNRCQVLLFGHKKWMTASINRDFSGTKKINQIEINDITKWRKTFFRSIEQSYKRHPHFNEVIGELEELIFFEEENLSKFNTNAIINIIKKLEFSSEKLVKSSSLEANGTSNELLIDLVKKSFGNIYLCGGGAETYQDDELFLKNDIIISYQNFTHPKYPQNKNKDFVQGLSIIDCLMNIGWENTAKLIKDEK